MPSAPRAVRASLAPSDRSVERVDDDGDDAGAVGLRLDVGDQLLVLLDQIEAGGEEVEVWILVFDAVVLAERGNPGSKAALALAGDIDHAAGLRLPAPIPPAEGDMHDHVEGEEGLAALWRAPDHREAFAGEQPLDQIVWRRRQRDVTEADQREAPVGRHVSGELAHVNSHGGTRL